MRTFRVVVLMDASRAWERGLIAGVARYSHLRGPWDFLKKPAFFMRRESEKFYDEISHFDPDGIIMREVPDTDRILSLKRPTIISGYKTEHFPGALTVSENCKATGRMAAEHLLSKGLKNFAYCGIDDLFWSRQRCSGFVHRIEKEGLRVSVYQPPSQIFDRGMELELPFLRQWLRSLPRPTGLMCCIDERSEQVAQMCKVENIHIPDDLAVIGVDNDEMICDLASPPLTSVSFDAEGIGYKAAEMLDGFMQKRLKNPGRLIIDPACVVQRQSTDLLAVGDRKIASAIQYIREHSVSRLTVNDVARFVMLPRRTLERRFCREIGSSVYKEIQNIRVGKAEELLARTDMTISEVADIMGFSEPSEFTRFYSRCRGENPSDYRKKLKGKISEKR